jgi:hypothetical protein
LVEHPPLSAGSVSRLKKGVVIGSSPMRPDPTSDRPLQTLVFKVVGRLTSGPRAAAGLVHPAGPWALEALPPGVPGAVLDLERLCAEAACPPGAPGGARTDNQRQTVPENPSRPSSWPRRAPGAREGHPREAPPAPWGNRPIAAIRGFPTRRKQSCAPGRQALRWGNPGGEHLRSRKAVLLSVSWSPRALPRGGDGPTALGDQRGIHLAASVAAALGLVCMP